MYIVGSCAGIKCIRDGPIIGALGEAASARLHSGSPVPHRLHHHNRFVSFHKWGLCHIPICRIKCGGVYYRTSHILRLSLMSFFFFRELRPSRDRLEQQHNRAERESGIWDRPWLWIAIWDAVRHHETSQHSWHHHPGLKECLQAVFTVVLLGFHLIGLILKCVYYRSPFLNHLKHLWAISF